MQLKRTFVVLCFLSLLAIQDAAYAMKRLGNILVEQGEDQHGRSLTHVINPALYDRANEPFTDIDRLPSFVVPSRQQVTFLSYTNALNEWLKASDSKPNPFFIIIDGEAVFRESNLKAPQPPTTYMVTGGVNNCVALTLWGHDPQSGDYFVGLAHIARINKISSIEPLLDKFTRYSVKSITLHSGYKSDHLLEIANFIASKGLTIESAFINKAYHKVDNTNKVSITYHPQYFEKSTIDEIDVSKNTIDLIKEHFIKIQIPSHIILHIPTGGLVPIDPRYIDYLLQESSTFRRFSEQVLRRKDLPMKNPTESIKLMELND